LVFVLHAQAWVAVLVSHDFIADIVSHEVEGAASTGEVNAVDDGVACLDSDREEGACWMAAVEDVVAALDEEPTADAVERIADEAGCFVVADGIVESLSN